jgi:uncharacterized membrane protein
MAKEENTPKAAPKAAPKASAAAPKASPAEAAAPQFVPAPVVPTNVLAIVSLVTGILGLTFAPFISSLAAIITGHISLHQIKATHEQGRGMAIAGLILGYVMLALALIALAVIIFIFVVSMNSYGMNPARMRGI